MYKFILFGIEEHINGEILETLAVCDHSIRCRIK